MPETINATIRIFNLLGEEIHTLVNEQKSAGIYEIHFDASMIPTGVYFYRLATSDFTSTKKMILVKYLYLFLNYFLTGLSVIYHT